MTGHALYVYGTLQVPAIFAQIVGRHLKAEPAILAGYARYRVQERAYPAIVEQPGAHVEGLVYGGLSSTELERLDLYEGELYERRLVTLPRAGVDMHAHAYVLRSALRHLLSSDAWDLGAFTRDHLNDYLNQIRATSRAP